MLVNFVRDEVIALLHSATDMMEKAMEPKGELAGIFGNVGEWESGYHQAKNEDKEVIRKIRDDLTSPKEE